MFVIGCQVILKSFMKDLYTTKQVTLWCAAANIGIWFPYVFDVELGRVLFPICIWKCYELFWNPNSQNLVICFEQNGETRHTEWKLMKFLRELFSGYFSPDSLTMDALQARLDLFPWDYFLWGYLKVGVYKYRPTTPEEIKGFCTSKNYRNTIENNSLGKWKL